MKRGAGYSTFEIYDVANLVKKGPLSALTFESSKNFILTYYFAFGLVFALIVCTLGLVIHLVSVVHHF